MNAHILQVSLQTFWHPGTGRGLGAAVDAAAHRDVNGLPTLPGRHIKGLLRNAMERAAAWNWPDYNPALVAHLFGDRTEHVSQNIPAPGTLRVSDARLPEDVAATLGMQNDDGLRLRTGLFRVLHATAIEGDSGTARDTSLRGIEVVVPLNLQAVIEPLDDNRPPFRSGPIACATSCPSSPRSARIAPEVLAERNSP